MAIRSAQGDRARSVETLGVVLPGLVIESVVDPDQPNRLRLHRWDGAKAETGLSTSYRGWTYTPAPLSEGLAKAVRFATTSKPFESTERLTTSMREFLCRYADLSPEAVALLIAFALASHFVDRLPVAPVLYLFGPELEAGAVLRLMACLCRRPVLLADVDIAALATLPSQLDATLLINQRSLTQRVSRVLHASNDRHFCLAHGKGRLNAFGAKAFSADPELVGVMGIHLSLSPSQDPLPTLTDAEEEQITNDFQAKLLRYRMVNHRRVREAQIDLRSFVPAMRDEVRAWLAPICDCPDLRKSVASSLSEKSRSLEGNRVSDDRCVIIEAVLFFCHRENTNNVFVGELAECVNTLLKGRHEDRILTDKKVGLLLRAVGIQGQRVVKGYRIELTEAVRQQIHRMARAYHVLSTQDSVARCSQCSNLE